MTKTVVTPIEWQYKIARALHLQRLQTTEILQTTLSMTCEALHAPQGCIVTFSDDQSLHHAFLFGSERDAESARELWTKQINQGIIHFARRGSKLISVPEVAQDPHWMSLVSSHSMRQTGAAVAVPLIHDERNYGVLALLHPEPDGFSRRAMELLQTIADVAAVALANAHLLEISHTREAGYRRLAERAQSERVEQEQMERLRHDLSAMTYHDLRGLVQNVQSSLMGMERMLMRGDAARAADLMGIALTSSRQVSRMVKGLLDIERLEQGMPILNRQETGVGDLIQEAIELLNPIAFEARQTLSGTTDEDIPRMIIDRDMILRVIMNLIENAIKHTPDGGRITVRAIWQGDHLLIRVTDTGNGIEAAYLSEIFDKYFRIKHAGAPNGVGLGLAYCRLAVEAHGGRIWAESGSGGDDGRDGQGAAFAFTLPAYQPDDEENETQGD